MSSAFRWSRPRLATARCPGTTPGTPGRSARTAVWRRTDLAADADLVIADRHPPLRLHHRVAHRIPESGVRILSINVNAMDAHKAGSFPLVGDAWEALLGLTPCCRPSRIAPMRRMATRSRHSSGSGTQRVDRTTRGSRRRDLTQAQAIGIVNEASDPSDVVVCAAGGMPGDLLKLWRPLDPKGYHVEYGFSCMGYEIAGGLGVKMADPSREVFVMVGDGSYLMMHTEIVTSLAKGRKINLVVVDNSGFQCIRGLQMSTGSPSFGNELRYRDPPPTGSMVN